jgi:hypothetical protein
MVTDLNPRIFIMQRTDPFRIFGECVHIHKSEYLEWKDFLRRLKEYYLKNFERGGTFGPKAN